VTDEVKDPENEFPTIIGYIGDDGKPIKLTGVLGVVPKSWPEPGPPFNIILDGVRQPGDYASLEDAEREIDRRMENDGE